MESNGYTKQPRKVLLSWMSFKLFTYYLQYDFSILLRQLYPSWLLSLRKMYSCLSSCWTSSILIQLLKALVWAGETAQALKAVAHKENIRTPVFKKIASTYEVYSSEAHLPPVPLFTFLLEVFSFSCQQFYARDTWTQTLPRVRAFGQNLRQHFRFKYIYFQF